MRQRRCQHIPHPSQQTSHGWIVAHIHPQRRHHDRRPDHRSHPLAMPVRVGSSDRQIGAPGVAAEHQKESGQHGDIGRDAAPAAHRVQLRSPFRRVAQPIDVGLKHRPVRSCSLFRPGPCRRISAAEPFLPVLPPLVHPGVQQGRLSASVFGILRRRRQVRHLARGERRIMDRDFGQHQGQRMEVEHGVVETDLQKVFFVSGPHQHSAQPGVASQVVGTTHFPAQQFVSRS